MKKVGNFLVNWHWPIFIVLIILSALSIYGMTRVNINEDMSAYLPSDSGMRHGLDIMEEEFNFSYATTPQEFKIMFEDLSEADKTDIYNTLLSYEGVELVSYNSSTTYNVDNYTLYDITSSYTSKKETESLIKNIKNTFSNYEITSYYEGSTSELMGILIPLAIIILVVVLLIMTKSLFEPVIMLVCIGAAILLNMGSNVMFSSVSDMTYSVAAVLQLILSIDYSIILLNRYREEHAKGLTKKEAMKNALSSSFKSIISSSLTTFVGLIALVFMSFTIGRDMGLVLAKGVLLSLISIFTIMPTLILVFDKIISKTEKTHIKNVLFKKKSIGGGLDD